MVSEIASPRMKDADHADEAADETRIGSQSEQGIGRSPE